MQARTIYRRHRDCELGLWIKVTFGAGCDAAGWNPCGLRLLAFSLGKFRATEPRARCAVRSPHMMEGYIAMGLLNRDGLTDKKIGAVVRMRPTAMVTR